MQKTRSHIVLGCLVGVAGLLNIFSSLLAHSKWRILLLQKLIPLEISNLSRTLTVVFGIVLIFLAKGLIERKKRALKLALVFLSLSLVTHLVKGLDAEEVVAELFLSFFLIKYRKVFTVLTHKLALVSTIKNILLVAFVFFLYSYIGHLLLTAHFKGDVTLKNTGLEIVHITTGYGHDLMIPTSWQAHWFHDSIELIATVVFLYSIFVIMSPFAEKPNLSEEDWDIATSLVKRIGHNSTSPLALMPDKNVFITTSRTGLISYRVKGKFAVVLGDPICYEEEFDNTVLEFAHYCSERGLSPVWYSVAESNLVHYTKYYKGVFSIGKEAIIKVKKFNLASSKLKNVRNAVKKIERDNIVFETYNFSDIPWSLLSQIDALHDSWIKRKKIPPMHFSLEYYPFPVNQDGFVLIAKKDTKVISVLSFFAYQRSSSYVLEMMVRGNNAPNGIMESSIARAIQEIVDRGGATLNLSLVPGYQYMDKIPHMLEKLYAFRPLAAFKSKFDPVWESKYLIYRSIGDLPSVLIALAQAHIDYKK